jgi:hypothetical protein
VDPPTLRFYVEDLLNDIGLDEPMTIDAPFAMRVLLDAFSSMDRSAFAQEDQPIDAWEVHRRVENHPKREDLLRWTAEPWLPDERVAAFARNVIQDVTVESRKTVEGEDGAFETAIVSVRVRDRDFLYHCAPGFNWTTALGC